MAIEESDDGRFESLPDAVKSRESNASGRGAWLVVSVTVVPEVLIWSIWRSRPSAVSGLVFCSTTMMLPVARWLTWTGGLVKTTVVGVTEVMAAIEAADRKIVPAAGTGAGAAVTGVLTALGFPLCWVPKTVIE